MWLHRCGNTFCFVLSMQFNSFLLRFDHCWCTRKAYCHKIKISFEILPQTDICDIDRHARKKWRERRKKTFLSNLYKAASRQAGIHWILEVSRIYLQRCKQALQNYSERQFQSITDLATAFFSHSKIYSHLAVVIYNA